MKFSEMLERMKTLDEKLSEQAGELFSEDMEELNELEQSHNWWGDYMARKYVEDKAHVDMCKKLSKLYSERGKRFQKRLDWRKKGLSMILGMMGSKNEKWPSATVYETEKTSLIIDESLVPEEFFTTKTVRELDKKKIEENIKKGFTISGVTISSGLSLVVRS